MEISPVITVLGLQKNANKKNANAQRDLLLKNLPNIELLISSSFSIMEFFRR